MATFLAAALAFPTVVFTVMVVLFLLYAMATLVGAFDIHWLDGVLGIDHVGDSVLEGALNSAGVAGIPLTIFGGVAAIMAWMASIAATSFLPDTLPIDLAVLLGSGLGGLALGGVAVRPLRGLFNAPSGPSRKQIVGKICTIRSLQVNAHSGTAEVENSGYIAEVRCFRENELTRGSKAIIFDYDQHNGIYHVGPIDPSIAQMDLDRRPQTDIA